MQPIKNLTDNRLQQLQAFLANHLGLNGKANTPDEFNNIFGTVMSLYNDICTQLSEKNFNVEKFFKSVNITDNLRHEKQKWARSYVDAAKLDMLWNHDEIMEDFFPIALLSFNQEQLQKLAENDDSRVEALLQLAEDKLSQSVTDVNEIWRKKRIATMPEMRAATP